MISLLETSQKALREVFAPQMRGCCRLELDVTLAGDHLREVIVMDWAGYRGPFQAGITARTPHGEDDKKAAASLYAANREFMGERNDMPVQYIQAFLLVAQEEGLSVTEYALRAKVSNSVATGTWARASGWWRRGLIRWS